MSARRRPMIGPRSVRTVAMSDSIKIDAFARLMTDKLATGDTNTLRSYIPSIVDLIEVNDGADPSATKMFCRRPSPTTRSRTEMFVVLYTNGAPKRIRTSAPRFAVDCSLKDLHRTDNGNGDLRSSDQGYPEVRARGTSAGSNRKPIHAPLSDFVAGQAAGRGAGFYRLGRPRRRTADFRSSFRAVCCFTPYEGRRRVFDQRLRMASKGAVNLRTKKTASG